MSKEIPLSKQAHSNNNKRNPGLVAIVDDEDYEFPIQWNWSAVSTHRRNGGYAMRRDNQNGTAILMHRVIFDAPAGSEVDHINDRTCVSRHVSKAKRIGALSRIVSPVSRECISIGCRQVEDGY